MHDPHLLKDDFRPARRVKLHRQSDQLKDQKDGEAVNYERDQGPAKSERKTGPMKMNGNMLDAACVTGTTVMRAINGA